MGTDQKYRLDNKWLLDLTPLESQAAIREQIICSKSYYLPKHPIEELLEYIWLATVGNGQKEQL